MNWLRIRAFATLLSASFVLQFAHLVQFVLTFSTGILFQILFYLFQKIFYDTQSPFGLESLITLIIVALSAAVSMNKAKEVYGTVNLIAIKHPVLFFTLPNTICVLVFMVSFAYVSRQFFTLSSLEYSILYQNWDTSGAYLLCASYIVYVVTSICYKDRVYIRDRITGHLCCQFVAFTVANLLQAATVFGVLKPLLGVFKVYLKNYGFQTAYIFGYMLLLGFLMGIASGVLEKYAHCVVHKRKAPFFWYENSVDARNSILQFLAFPIHYGFFKPEKSLPVESSSEHFSYFAVYSSLALMQFTKILYLIVFDHRNLDVVCGYSNRTSARERRLSRPGSRSPGRGNNSTRARPHAAQGENTQFYEGSNEEPEWNNNQTHQQSRDDKQLVNHRGKPEKPAQNFLGLLLPIELPVSLITTLVMSWTEMFVRFAGKACQEAYPEGISSEYENGIQVDTSANLSSDFLKLEDIRFSTSKEFLPGVHTLGLKEPKSKSRSRSLTAVINVEDEKDFDQNYNAFGNDEIFKRAYPTAKVFADHVSGDNVHALESKASVEYTAAAETKDIC